VKDLDIEALIKENHVLQQIFIHVDVGITAIDANGVFIYYNPVAEDLDGLKAEDVIGKHITEVYPNLYNNSTLFEVQKTGKPIIERVQTYETRQGKVVNILCSTFPLTFKGKTIGSCDLARDITNVKQLSDQNIALKEELLKRVRTKRKVKNTGAKYTFNDIITNNENFMMLKDIANRVAKSVSPILIYGETGTGKELFAQAIHNHGNRLGPFIAQNCAALPASLLESILFGTIKGSFTGAEDRMGLLELADEGTLFLDEVNSMPLELQSKILRFLQEGTFRRVGDIKLQKVNVRIIACSNIEPLEAVKLKQLRNDLYYRLNVIYLQIPPLRERMSDIPMLIDYFISHYNKKLGIDVTGVNSNVISIFNKYTWPGNVRELQHCIEHAMNVGLGKWIRIEDLPLNILKNASINPNLQYKDGIINFSKNKSLKNTLNEVEKKIICEILKECNGNISKAAKILEMPRQTLHYRLKVLGNFDPNCLSDDYHR